MSYIRIKAGSHRGIPVVDEVFHLVKPFKLGVKGGFVTVDGSNKFGIDAKKIRVRVDRASSYEFIDEATYLEADTVAIPAGPDDIVEVFKSDQECMADIAERFEILTEMTKATLNGDIRAMIVSGPPGVGKSFGIERELDKASLFDQIAGRRVKSEVVRGSTSALGLYCALYKNSDKNHVVVFDDCDEVFFDTTCLNLLKGALDTGKKRRISWLADSHMLRREGVPDSFEFNGSVIFITNLQFTNIRSKKLQDHLAALESRCHFVDLKINTMRDKILRIRQIVGDGMLDEYDFDRCVVDEIVEFIAENADKWRELSLRTVVKIAQLRKAFPANWKRYTQSSLMKQE